jgi:hypothetical protein
MRLPATTQRVTLHSAEWKTLKIERDMEQRLWYYLDHPGEIGLRLRELNAEWDIERTVGANASSLALLGLGLGATVSRKFYLMPAVIMGFFLQHALQGWCPPIPLLRRLGVRTQYEIELERYALKALRGDFGELGMAASAPEAKEDRELPERVMKVIRR